MYTSKGSTIYKDGVEMCYVRSYIKDEAGKIAFVAQIASALNSMEHAIPLHNALTDLVGLVKAPDKNLTTYAGQVRSTLRDADKALHEYRESIPRVMPTPYVDDDDLLDPKAIEAAAGGFDRNLSEIAREHADGNDIPVIELPLVLGHEMRAIPIERVVPAEMRDFPGAGQPKTAVILSGAEAAIRTLQGKGYTYHGGEQWKPPIGPVPDFERQVEPLRDPPRVEAVLSNVPATLTAITPVQRDAILAGLRLLQLALQTGKIELNELAEIVDQIAADSGECLSVDAIDELCETLNQ